MNLKQIDEIVWFKVAEKICSIHEDILDENRELSILQPYLKEKLFNKLMGPVEEVISRTGGMIVSSNVVNEMIFTTYNILRRVSKL